MKKIHYFWFAIWLIPAYLGFMIIHQFNVFNGLTQTYENGESYIADVIEFDIKQIAAQTNGYIVLQFTPEGADEITQKLSQPIQNAAQLMASELLPVRYLPGSYQEIVIVPIYEFHRKMVKANMAMLGVGFLITIFVSFITSRFARRKISGELKEPEFELVE